MSGIKDVARLAGVSISTVSKYFNNPHQLTEEYKVRVEKAVQALNYRPSIAARSLRTQRSHAIALIVPEITNPFYTDIYTAVRAAAYEQGYTTILFTTEEDHNALSELLSEVPGRRVDGLILAFIDEDENIGEVQDLQSSIPIVLFSWDVQNTGFSSVIVNLFDSLYQSTKHLIDLGHQRIAYVNGPQNSRVSKEKYRGYHRAMLDAKLEIRDDLLYTGRYSFQTGYYAVKAFMQTDAPPTAVVCANDILAIGCLKYLDFNGYKVPEDVAVMGLDGIQLSSIYYPSVSTMYIPVEDMSREAVQMLMYRINHPNAKNRQAVFDTSLQVRMSTKKDAPLILDI